MPRSKLSFVGAGSMLAGALTISLPPMQPAYRPGPRCHRGWTHWWHRGRLCLRRAATIASMTTAGMDPAGIGAVTATTTAMATAAPTGWHGWAVAWRSGTGLSRGLARRPRRRTWRLPRRRTSGGGGFQWWRTPRRRPDVRGWRRIPRRRWRSLVVAGHGGGGGHGGGHGGGGHK